MVKLIFNKHNLCELLFSYDSGFLAGEILYGTDFGRMPRFLNKEELELLNTTMSMYKDSICLRHISIVSEDEFYHTVPSAIEQFETHVKKDIKCSTILVASVTEHLSFFEKLGYSKEVELMNSNIHILHKHL